MTNFFKKNISVLILLLITCVFFYKTIFRGLIPFPGDMLVGAYYPWLDYKWGGFVTSVPVKNPLITDVFSQFYLWKKTTIVSLKNFQFPFWNMYSYSGYPLYANFHSGVLNPFNLLMLIFGDSYGWALLVMSQFLFCFYTMYLFLNKIHPNNLLAPIIGSITYAFSGFMITWSQFVTAGFAMIWLPIIFLNIENFFNTKKIKYILYLPILYFLMMTSGHLQALVYGFVISTCYFLYKNIQNILTKKISTLYWYLLALIISILLMALQLLPTLEMGKYSVRFDENYISEYNYGLFSLERIVTFIAPDYFGNPTTFNYWGSFNYHETVIYSSILTIFALIFCVYNFRKLKNEKFFLITAFLSLLLAFDTTLGKLIYKLNVPGLSTSAAGRIAIIFVFCSSILVAYFIKNINLLNLKSTFRYYWKYLLFLIFISAYTLIKYKNNNLYPILQQNYLVSLRNLFLPIVISISIFFVLAFIKNINLKRVLILLIVIFDLFRFGWKYTPFVNKEYIFPKTDITSFLQNESGLFRIEKERGPLLTPNTWTAYGLSSPSGYDPMAINDYSKYFQSNFNNQLENPISSRYSEIDNYKAKELGEANVKYLLALKYDDIDKISSDGNHLNYKINLNDWSKVYEHGSVVILENNQFKPRIEILNQNSQDSIKNIIYSQSKISFQANSEEDNSTLILRDTWYPGWKAFVNNEEVKINKYLSIYRQIIIPKGESTIEFIYQPRSFYYGFYISFFSFLLWLILYKNFKNKEIK
ncbi:MAG: YfhO family protein [Sphaerochaetaceae bacterium]|nr:YfhO family protein [Sphaerochaetaceae bacterium]